MRRRGLYDIHGHQCAIHTTTFFHPPWPAATSRKSKRSNCTRQRACDRYIQYATKKENERKRGAGGVEVTRESEATSSLWSSGAKEE
mmetsp:Transcript_34533/g.110904  ORF Transcript_34533/g.110904 Transcript_34533/m.110904 type:complete len:87 (-) Transcript_34533:546-806(-)